MRSPSGPRAARRGLFAGLALYGAVSISGLLLAPYPASPSAPRAAGVAPTRPSDAAGLPPAPASGSGMDGPGPAPGMAVAPAGGPDAEDPEAPFTEEVLLRRILSRPLAKWSFVLFRFVAAVIGLVVLILWGNRRLDERRGAVPAPPARPPAVMPFEPAGALGVLLLWFGAGPLVAQAIHAIRGGGGAPPTANGIFAMSFTSLPLAAWIALRARQRRASQATDCVPLPTSLKVGGLGFLASATSTLALSLLAALVLTVLLGHPPELQPLAELVVKSPDPLVAAVIAIFGILVAPFAEEAVFRGALYPAARSLLGARGAALGVSALFAAIHLNALAALPLFGLALLLTWCYERTGSILACVLVHAASNAASLVPLLFAR